MEMGYATDLHREALIATAVVLFVLILIINLCCSALQRGNRTVMEKLKGQLESYKSQSFSLVLRLLMWIATFLTVGITVCIVGYILIRGIPESLSGDVCLGI